MLLTGRAVSPRQTLIGGLAAFLALIVLAAIAPAARAAEFVYWDNYSGTPDTIAYANIDGTGGGLLNVGSSVVETRKGWRMTA